MIDRRENVREHQEAKDAYTVVLSVGCEFFGLGPVSRVTSRSDNGRDCALSKNWRQNSHGVESAFSSLLSFHVNKITGLS